MGCDSTSSQSQPRCSGRRKQAGIPQAECQEDRTAPPNFLPSNWTCQDFRFGMESKSIKSYLVWETNPSRLFPYQGMVAVAMASLTSAGPSSTRSSSEN